MFAGVDETGRGSCIGALYTAACVMPADYPITGIVTDSKKLSATKLQQANAQVRRDAVAFYVDFATQAEVETLNPTQATILSWHRCLDHVRDQMGVGNFDKSIDKIIVDGTCFRPWTPAGLNDPFPHKALPKADGAFASVAAASILAKVARDAYILNLCEEHPELREYDIHNNMGYPSTKHKAAVGRLGLTQFHRSNYNIKGTT